MEQRKMDNIYSKEKDIQKTTAFNKDYYWFQ